MTQWEKAQMLRGLAVRAATKHAAVRLYVKASQIEKAVLKNGEPLPVTTYNSEDKEARTQLPKWFKDAKKKLRCQGCGIGYGTYWYKKEDGKWFRCRLQNAVKRGHTTMALETMKAATHLCRKCAAV